MKGNGIYLIVSKAKPVEYKFAKELTMEVKLQVSKDERDDEILSLMDHLRNQIISDCKLVGISVMEG